MKRKLILVLVAVLLLSLVACGGREDSSSAATTTTTGKRDATITDRHEEGDAAGEPIEDMPSGVGDLFDADKDENADEQKENPLGADALYDAQKDIAVRCIGIVGAKDHYSLDIYEYAEGELSASTQAALGNLSHKAYDIALVYNDAFIHPEKGVLVAFSIPAGFDFSKMRAYYCDYSDNLSEAASYVEGQYLIVQNSTPGQFILVEGRLPV